NPRAEMISAMLDSVELEVSAEVEGQRLAEAEKALKRMNEIALHVKAEGIIDHLDALPLLPRELLPRRYRWRWNRRTQYRVLGALVPGEEPPEVLLYGIMETDHHHTRLFLLSNEGMVKTLDVLTMDVLGGLTMKGILKAGQFWEEIPGLMWNFSKPIEGRKSLH